MKGNVQRPIKGPCSASFQDTTNLNTKECLSRETCLSTKIKVEIPSVDIGRKMIRERLFGKRMLIVLDDVPHFCELLDILKCNHLFSGGTVIIITTRDEHILRQLGIDSIFQSELMNKNESLELLSWHAFREAKPKKPHYDHAIDIVHYCGGLPLALEVIGSSLFERTGNEWYWVWLELQKIPSHNVEQILRISFRGLRNEMVQDLFLDVCCFFVGKGRAYTKILNGCGVYADSGIRILIERSLVKVKKNNKFGMHPLLQEMGITIIREISVKEPWPNRRLLFDKDTKYVRTFFLYVL